MGSVKKTIYKGDIKALEAKRKKTDFHDTFVENLLIKKRELEKILEGLMKTQKEYGGQTDADDFIDEFDAAQREIFANEHCTLIERKIRELQKVDSMIHDIPTGKKFGICEECAAPIPNERLAIIPDATLCVGCQGKLEKLSGLGLKSMEPEPSVLFGKGKGKEPEENEIPHFQDYTAIKSHLDDFSVDDPEGKDSENIH